MVIKLIDYNGRAPERNHMNDAGADVFAKEKTLLKAGEITKVPLGFGIHLPNGFVGFVLPRSGMSSNYNLTTEVVPIDSGYTGEIHAIMYNANKEDVVVKQGTKVAQLVIVPTVLASFTYQDLDERGTKGFGSSDNVLSK